MNPLIILAVVIALIVLALWFPRYRLKRALAGPFPEEWALILEKNIGILARPPDYRFVGI